MNEIELKQKGKYWFAIRRDIKCFGYGLTEAEALADLVVDIDIFNKCAKS